MRLIVLFLLVAEFVACHSDGDTGVGTNSLASMEANPMPGTEFTQLLRLAEVPDVVDPVDFDSDGYSADIDPDDENPTAFPSADEIQCNGVDEDGDGADRCPADIDGDGDSGDVDCNDADARVGPHATEERCNGRDENCDGFDDCDSDDDGFVDWFDPDPGQPELESDEGSPLWD